LKELDDEMLDALGDQTRREILKLLAERPRYPSSIAKELGADKQRVYYHIQSLEDAGLIQEDHTETVSGGTATYYRPSSKIFGIGLGEELPETGERAVENLLHPLVQDGELAGRIVVGSPDKHGPDQVRARDGHLAGEIGLKIGPDTSLERKVFKDTEIIRDNLFDSSMILIGGVLTNTVTKKLNPELPASFSGESFPYREITTPEASYSEEDIGMVAKTENPEGDGCIVVVAGVRNEGTEAAVRAFKNLEDIIEDNRPEEFYAVVRGLDMDGDGEIDQYELVEKG
jgi:DNA-binding transcriptional ArsR family regulator